jgi:hypothetical protein
MPRRSLPTEFEKFWLSLELGGGTKRRFCFYPSPTAVTLAPFLRPSLTSQNHWSRSQGAQLGGRTLTLHAFGMFYVILNQPEELLVFLVFK